MTPSAFATTSAAKARCRIVRKAGEKPMAAPRTLMTQLSTPLAHLYADCEARRVRIRQEFESRWNARETLSALCQLADDSVVQIHDALFPQSRRARKGFSRSEEHTSELQSRLHLVCRLLLEKKKKTNNTTLSAQVRS